MAREIIPSVTKSQEEDGLIAIHVEFCLGDRHAARIQGKWPKLGERVFIAEGAQIIGDVEVGDHSSIWYNCVIRGDVHYIRIGRHTNIQDGSICHVMKDEFP